jgi:hypothetical protein
VTAERDSCDEIEEDGSARRDHSVGNKFNRKYGGKFEDTICPSICTKWKRGWENKNRIEKRRRKIETTETSFINLCRLCI